MKKKILITAALPYANGALHFGHMAGAYLPADVYARYCRLRGWETLFICGSDEYGVAITLSAEKAGRSPQEHVNLFHAVNEQLFKKLNIAFDHYSRTTWKGHDAFVLQFFEELKKNGYIEPRETLQLYSEKEGRFLADRYVVGSCPHCGFDQARGDECQKCGASYEAEDLKNPKSAMTGSPLILKKTTNWFLLLDKLHGKIEDWLKGKEWKSNTLNFVTNYLKDVRPRAITRDSSWGIPVPGVEGKVFYVWFDAPIGYISATAEWAALKNQPEEWKEYWFDPKTTYVQFIGKDNIPFHGVIFPAMVLGQDKPYKLVDQLPANEFYNLEGRQFSKSDGWMIDLEDFLNRYSADQLRYVIAANAPETGDSEFTWKDFQQRSNSELLGKLGNFVNRVLTFAFAHFEGKVPEAELQPVDQAFLNAIGEKKDQIASYFDHFQLRKAAAALMEMAQLSNVYFDNKKPWVHKETAAATIAVSLEAIQTLALVASPIIPETAHKMGSFLNADLSSWETKPLKPGHLLKEPSILFKRIEDVQIEEELKKLKKPMTEETTAPTKSLISIEDFDKIDLKVGLVTQAEKVPKSKKLLKLEVDLGFEKRQILSGISLHFQPEELVGKKVVVVANLKPATLMGLESQGMVLAVHDGEALHILDGGPSAPGSSIS